MDAAGFDGVKGLAHYFSGLFDSAEATETSQTLIFHRYRTPQNTGQQPWFSDSGPPTSWLNLSCPGALRETGISSRAPKALGADTEGDGSYFTGQ